MVVESLEEIAREIRRSFRAHTRSPRDKYYQFTEYIRQANEAIALQRDGAGIDAIMRALRNVEELLPLFGFSPLAISISTQIGNFYFAAAERSSDPSKKMILAQRSLEAHVRSADMAENHALCAYGFAADAAELAVEIAKTREEKAVSAKQCYDFRAESVMRVLRTGDKSSASTLCLFAAGAARVCEDLSASDEERAENVSNFVFFYDSVRRAFQR